jgi:ribosomal protein S27AE
VALLLVWGILRGARLAWMWGRALGFFLAVVPLAAMGLGLWRGLAMRWWEAAVVVLGLSAPLLAASIALGRKSALQFFDLVCPTCGTVAKRGKDFLFRRALCGKCGHVW